MMPAKIALEEHFLLRATPTPTWPPNVNPAIDGDRAVSLGRRR